MKVPEKINSAPCRFCGYDHPDERCPFVNRDECKRCGAKMRFSIELDEKICSSINCGWPIGR